MGFVAQATIWVTKGQGQQMEESISWGELAELTHETQVEKFQFCMCEEQQLFPYEDCPRLKETWENEQFR